MGELRSKQIMVSIEESFYEVLSTILQREDWSASGYFRSLMITDLMKRGMLNEDMLADVLRVPRAARI